MRVNDDLRLPLVTFYGDARSFGCGPLIKAYRILPTVFALSSVGAPVLTRIRTYIRIFHDPRNLHLGLILGH